MAWSLCQCGFLQFLIPDGRTLYFVDFFSFFLFPVPFNLFVCSICRTKYRRGLCGSGGGISCEHGGGRCGADVRLAGYFPDDARDPWADGGECALRVLGRQPGDPPDGRPSVKRFRLPLYIIMAFALMELAMYYANDFRDTSVFLPIGTIVFIAVLVWIQVARYYRAILEEQKLAYFEKLANMDILTEALNRNAYENTLKRLEQQELEVKATCVVLFDINDMKRINDNFGHENGDAALKSCYRCIQKAFGSGGELLPHRRG